MHRESNEIYEIVISRAPDSPGRYLWTVNCVRVKSSPILESQVRSLSIAGTKASAVRFLRGSDLDFPIRVAIEATTDPEEEQ